MMVQHTQQRTQPWPSHRAIRFITAVTPPFVLANLRIHRAMVLMHGFACHLLHAMYQPFVINIIMYLRLLPLPNHDHFPQTRILTSLEPIVTHKFALPSDHLSLCCVARPRIYLHLMVGVSNDPVYAGITQMSILRALIVNLLCIWVRQRFLYFF